MYDNWESVYSTNQSYDAEMIKTMMADNDIECVIMNKQDSTYGIGEIELYVLAEDIIKAKQLIQEFRGE
ncbi:MAG: DUF2007 domain-containing protein [Bacteroidota bacterium]